MKICTSINCTMVPDKIITTFLDKQTALTIATTVDDNPYCATCFYAYSGGSGILVFKSSRDTIHIQNGIKNSRISGCVLPDKLIIGKVQGVQFSGVFVEPEGKMLEEAKRSYYKKYPFALAIPGELWAVKLSHIKFTDSTLGFGKKLIWDNQEEVKAVS